MTDEQDVKDHEDDLDEGDVDLLDEAPLGGRTGFLSGMLLGALIGAGIALLVAPQSGAVMRRRLTTGARRLADDTRDQVEDWADDARRELKRRRRRMRKRVRR